MAPAAVVFTTSVGFDIFNCEVCRVFFSCQGCILQRGHDHTNVPMTVKGYAVGSTSWFNTNNAGLQYFIVKGKWSVTAEFVVLFSNCELFNNGVKMIVPMPDAGLCCRLMHVVETTIQIYFRPLFYEKVKHLWR